MSQKFYLILVTLLGSCFAVFYFLRSKTDLDVATAAKMVGGQLGTTSSFPYHVQYGPRCNGAIISLWWMIAPANCAFYDYVRVGSQYRDHGRIKKISRRVTHPQFRNKSNIHILEYNFQLMKFEEKLYTDDCAAPIAVSLLQKDDLNWGTWFTVTGFGETYASGPLSDLRLIFVKIQNDSTCEGPKHHLGRRNITRNLICAGTDLGTTIGSINACSGDVGGAMVFKKALVALVMHGQGCYERIDTLEKYEYRSSLYSLISPVIEWIKDVTSEDNDVEFILQRPSTVPPEPWEWVKN